MSDHDYVVKAANQAGAQRNAGRPPRITPCSMLATDAAPVMTRRPGSRSRQAARDRRSEIRLVGFRDLVVEQHPVALGADFLLVVLLHAPESSHRRPGL